MKNLIQYNLSFADIAVRYALVMAFGILFGATVWYPFIILALMVFLEVSAEALRRHASVIGLFHKSFIQQDLLVTRCGCHHKMPAASCHLLLEITSRSPA